MNNCLHYHRNNIEVVKYPIITEKTTRLLENNRYTFLVDRYANKISIAKAIECLFNVKVIKINTCNLPKKQKRVGNYIGWKSQYKKAMVTLSENNIINLFTED